MFLLLQVLLLPSAVFAQQTIQSRDGKITWICPAGPSQETALARKCAQKSRSGAQSLTGLQAQLNYPDVPPSDPFVTQPNDYHLFCTYGTDGTRETLFTCEYTGANQDLASGSNSDCPILNSAQPSARAFLERRNQLNKRYDVPTALVCPDTGGDQQFYRSKVVGEYGSRDATETGWVNSCFWYEHSDGITSQIVCGYDADGDIVRYSEGQENDCPTSFCNPVEPTNVKRDLRTADPIASRQQQASRLRRRDGSNSVTGW